MPIALVGCIYFSYVVGIHTVHVFLHYANVKSYFPLLILYLTCCFLYLNSLKLALYFNASQVAQ